MITQTYDYLLVFAYIPELLMASFTGEKLAKSISAPPEDAYRHSAPRAFQVLTG
jgi:hypothetical protein